MDIMTHAKFHFDGLKLTMIFGIRSSEPPPPQAWRTTEKAGPDRVKGHYFVIHAGFYIINMNN